MLFVGKIISFSSPLFLYNHFTTYFSYQCMSLSLVSFMAWVKMTIVCTFQPRPKLHMSSKVLNKTFETGNVCCVIQHKHVLWCLETKSACRSEVTRRENTYLIWWWREACQDMEWQKCCFVNSKNYMIFISPGSDCFLSLHSSAGFFQFEAAASWCVGWISGQWARR